MTNATTPEREEKHILMHNAIEGMGEISSRLDDLLNRLRGQETEKSEVCGKEGQPPSFIDVLAGGPSAIKDRTELAIERINQLSELLF